jgi:gamma-glutamylcyclotransferase (GGCT)/AIG2-like uncharacterized protein YtfP
MYHFAYGSNLNYEHMRRLCGWHFTLIGLGTLEGYELGLDLRGYVNIRPKTGEKVVGVLYDLDQQCLDILDEYEGYPEVFNRILTQVTDQNGHSYKAWTYLEKPEAFGGTQIKSDHLKLIIAGAMENHLPEDWIKYLDSLQSFVRG